jgi:hypothetical protein
MPARFVIEDFSAIMQDFCMIGLPATQQSNPLRRPLAPAPDRSDDGRGESWDAATVPREGEDQ